MKILEIVNKLDVKSVQYDTIGYLLMRIPAEFYIADEFEERHKKAIYYYIENYRETRKVIW